MAALGKAMRTSKAALQAAVSTASVVMLPVAVGRLLGISAIESRGDVDVDYNRELAVPNAVMYAVQATVGFMPCGTSVVTCLLMRDLGGTTKLAPLVALVLVPVLLLAFLLRFSALVHSVSARAPAALSSSRAAQTRFRSRSAACPSTSPASLSPSRQPPPAPR